MLAVAVLAFNSSNLQMRCGHIGLQKQFAPCRTDAHHLEDRSSIGFDKRKTGGSKLGLELKQRFAWVLTCLYSLGPAWIVRADTGSSARSKKT